MGNLIALNLILSIAITVIGMNETIVEYISGIEVIKAFNQGKNSYAKFSERVIANAAYYYNWMKRCQLNMSLAQAITPTTLITVLPVGWLLYRGGSLSIETFVMSIILSLGIVGPLMAAMSILALNLRKIHCALLYLFTYTASTKTGLCSGDIIHGQLRAAGDPGPGQQILRVVECPGQLQPPGVDQEQIRTLLRLQRAQIVPPQCLCTVDGGDLQHLVGGNAAASLLAVKGLHHPGGAHDYLRLH